MNAFGISDVGKVRNNNEDSMFFSDKPFSFLPNLYIVADGLGGHNSGEVASSKSIEFFLEYCEKNPKNNDISAFLSEAAQFSNKKIYEMAMSRREYEGMGTTLSVCAYAGSALYIAHIGDSRIYGFDGENITQYTADHTFVGEMVKYGQLTLDEAKTHHSRHMLTRALGQWYEARFDLSVVAPAAKKIVLCTDGLTNMLADGEISEILKQTPDDNAKTAMDLLSAAIERGGHDNTTLIVFDIL